MHNSKISLGNLTILELLLDNRGDSFAFAQHHHAGGVCIQSMNDMRSAGEPHYVQNIAQCVAIESSRGMNRQRRRLGQDDEFFVFMQDSDVGGNIGFNRHRLQLIEAFAFSNKAIG